MTGLAFELRLSSQGKGKIKRHRQGREGGTAIRYYLLRSLGIKRTKYLLCSNLEAKLTGVCTTGTMYVYIYLHSMYVHTRYVVVP